MGALPAPDMIAEPDGFVVVVEPGDRIHFLDWDGARVTGRSEVGALLVHGLAQSAWIWTPVARRLRGATPVVAMDLRGHGLSDAPTEDGAYDLAVLAGDVVAVMEGSGLVSDVGERAVIAGHGFGAIVAAAAASGLGPRCAGLVLVDGGWESLETSTGLDVDAFLRALDEPPEVMRSMSAFVADRTAFDPGTWDADQERAARATVVETHAGRVVPVTRPHVLEACVRTMFAYDPITTLAAVEAPVVAIAAAASRDDVPAARDRDLAAASAARVAAGRDAIAAVSFGHDGHNLMRYRPDAISATILALAIRTATTGES